MVTDTEERVELHGRRFTFRYTVRPEDSRVEAVILEGWGNEARPYIPHPARGRDAADARERAMTALQNYAGMDRYLGLVRQVSDLLAPGSRLQVDEDAREIRVDLVGPQRLRAPLALVREDALDPERTDDELLAFIRAHFEGYLEATPG